MKYSVATILSAALIAACGFTGCASEPHGHSDMHEPAITTSVSRHEINAGESVLVTANTYNLVGASKINWKVSPSGAKLDPQSNTSGQTALFSAAQPGTYLVHAEAQAADGHWVSSEVAITVSGSMRNVR